jgi:multidrug efflux system membrane fusion protein
MKVTTMRSVPALSLLAFLFPALLAGCGKGSAPQAGPAGGPPVTVAAAIEKDIIETDEFPGRIEAVEQVEIRGRVTGYIQAIHFKPGAEVKKGDLLFTLDPRQFEADVSRAEGNLASTQAQLDLAKIEVVRQEKLFADQATSKREYDDAAARVRTLEAQLKSNQGDLERARLNLSYTRITSPVTGRVSKAEITAGNLVQGEVPNSPLLTTVVSLNPIYVAFEADERIFLKYVSKARAVGRLSVGVGLADEVGFPHTGKLDFVDNRVEAQSGTVRMRAVLDNKSGVFTPGLFARVKLGDTTTPRSVVLVQDRAIGTDQSKRFVLVVNGDNTAQYREVKIGRLVGGGLRVIDDGLKAGEKIVVNGLQRVRPGAPITPEVVAMEGGDKSAPAADAKGAEAKAPDAKADAKSEEKGGK